MKTPDVNVLLYAINEAADQHEEAKEWLTESISGPELLGLSWLALSGYLRISTHPGALPSPLDPAQSIADIEAWLRAPGVRTIEPGVEHLQTLRRVVLAGGARGNQVPDSHLASIAIEHRATLATFDSDFHRYAELDLEYLGAS